MFIIHEFDKFVKIIFILGFIKILIIDENTGVFFFLMKREFVWKDFELLKIFIEKEYDFIQIEYSCVYKISSKTLYKVSRIESIEDAKK